MTMTKAELLEAYADLEGKHGRLKSKAKRDRENAKKRIAVLTETLESQGWQLEEAEKQVARLAAKLDAVSSKAIGSSGAVFDAARMAALESENDELREQNEKLKVALKRAKSGTATADT